MHVADARVVEGLPWLIRKYADRMDLDWLLQQAKLHNLQNRLGFLLQLSRADASAVLSAIRELERAPRQPETTLCWDSMPAAVRLWMRTNRSPLAEHWNLLTRVSPKEIDDAA